eukprot:gene722-803_t
MKAVAIVAEGVITNSHFLVLADKTWRLLRAEEAGTRRRTYAKTRAVTVKREAAERRRYSPTRRKMGRKKNTMARKSVLVAAQTRAPLTVISEFWKRSLGVE